MTIDELWLELDTARDFSIPDMPRKFGEIVTEIARFDDPKTIPGLLRYFDDQTEFHDVMWSIVHAVEKFDSEVYLHALLSNISEAWAHSPMWVTILHYRILNSPKDVEQYIETTHGLSDEHRTIAKDILATIRDTEPDFAERCQYLLRGIW